MRQKVRTCRQAGFAPILIVIILAVLGIVSAYYIGTKKAQVQLTPVGTQNSTANPSSVATTSPTGVTSTPKPSLNPTANWKTFLNGEFTFRYPKEWTLNETGNTITANVDGAKIYIFDSNSPMYNECMLLGKTDTVEGKMVKYYGYAYSGEACSNKDALGNYQAWITKAGGNGFQPGIIYAYNTTAFPNSFEIFKQILPTFKFTP